MASDTDVGVDLYCESVERETPFMHFWLQVKSGDQCKILKNGRASCAFERRHLSYWQRQPVPVFAALVPTEWPVSQEPYVYIVDLGARLIPVHRNTVRFRSDYTWKSGEDSDIRHFMSEIVPVAAACLLYRHGVVGCVPELSPGYIQQFAQVPTQNFQDKIVRQIRQTSAFSVIMAYNQNRIYGGGEDEFCQTLGRVLEQFSDDQHWETFVARGLCHHARSDFDAAKTCYEHGIHAIESDPQVRQDGGFLTIVDDIRRLLDRAASGLPIYG